MGRKRSLLGFFAYLCMALFTHNAMAEGYVCEDSMQFITCDAGFYLNSESVGNDCVDCTTAANTAVISETSIDNGTRSETCVGYYTGGDGGAEVGAAASCTGCSESAWSCSCADGYVASGSGADCTCVTGGGYMCDKTYSTCKLGFFLENGMCYSCVATSNTDVQEAIIIDNGVRNRVCTGNYTAGTTAGAGDAAAQCSGCSSDTWVCNCDTGYHVAGTGDACTCVQDEGYVCDDLKKYTSCERGYYMATADANGVYDYNGVPVSGNRCLPCPEDGVCSGGTDAPTFEIILDSNGGVGVAGAEVIDAMPYKDDTMIGEYTVPTPVKFGYDFTGYYYADDAESACDGSGVQYFDAPDADDTYSYATLVRMWDKMSGATLYACWTPTRTTVSLDFDGGTLNNTVPETGTYKVLAEYDSTLLWGTFFEPMKTGYTFGGFYDQQDCNGTAYINATRNEQNSAYVGTKLWDKTSATATLYACWEPKNTVVTVDAQGGDVYGITTINATYDEKPIWNIGALPTKQGYDFGGLYEGSDCAGNRYFGNNIDANGYITADSAWAHENANMTLYACWTPACNTIVLDANGGESGENTILSFVTNDSVLSLGATCDEELWSADQVMPTRDGYTFAGFVGPNSDRTDISQDTEFEPYISLEINPDGDEPLGLMHAAGNIVSELDDGAVTVYARWVKNPTMTGSGDADVYVGCDWGNVDICNMSVVYDFTCDTGYELGMSTSTDAMCSAKSYTITLNKQGGTGGADSVDVTYNSLQKLTGEMPHKTGYTFRGYDSLSNCNGVRYWNGDGEALVAWTIDADTEVYACWDVNTYTVTLDAGDGTGGDASVDVVYDSQIGTVNIAVPALSKFIFGGYNTAADCGGTQYFDTYGKLVRVWDIAENTTLYACWTAAPLQCAPGYYYNAETQEIELCPAGSYCDGTESGTECHIESCPSDFPMSVAGTSEEGKCYAACETGCEKFDLPSTFYNVVWKVTEVSGIEYNDGTGVCHVENPYCQINFNNSNTVCISGHYMTATDDPTAACDSECASLPYGALTEPYSGSTTPNLANGEYACWGLCQPKCNVYAVREIDVSTGYSTGNVVNWCPEHAICTEAYEFGSSAGRVWYPDDNCISLNKTRFCQYTFTCEDGYEPSTDNAVNYGYAREGFTTYAAPRKAQCNPATYTITLNDNGGENGDGDIYQKYSVGWFSDADTNAEIASVALPQRVGYTFAGYYTAQTALESYSQVVDASGQIKASPTFIENKTLYAWWTPNVYKINLNDNGGNSGSGVIYQIYNTGWYNTPVASDNPRNAINVPKRTGHVFTGYCSDTLCLPADLDTGALPAATMFTDENTQNGEITLFAGWTPNTYEIALVDTLDEEAVQFVYEVYGTKWIDEEGNEVSTVDVLNREPEYTFKGFYDSEEGGTLYIGVDGALPGNSTFVSDAILYAQWTQNSSQCVVGEYYLDGVQTQCVAPYYCPGEGSVNVGDTGCITECPNDGYLGDQQDDGTWEYRADENGTSIYQCHKEMSKLPSSVSMSFENGTANWDCYYSRGNGSAAVYASNCAVVPLTCNAGYYYDGTGTGCKPVVSGNYNEGPSSDTPLTAKQCPTVDGYNVYSIAPRSSITDCYLGCELSTNQVEHSVSVTPTNGDDKAMYISGTTTNNVKYETCEYTVRCEDGYTPINGANPSCKANEYIVTLNKNGGSGNVPDSMTCVFDSGECALPGTAALQRPGYVNVERWCTDANGAGECFDANKVSEYSAKGQDITLYAQWTPGVFKVELNTPNATENGVQNPVYLKYSVGWYSDAAVSKPIEKLANVPVRLGYDFAGYRTNTDVQMIDKTGAFITTETALTSVTNDASATVIWTEAFVTCQPGEYYKGTGIDCSVCEKDSYCTGGDFATEGGQAGLASCPNGGLSDGGINAKDMTACYKPGMTYTSDHASGTWTCNFTKVAYDNCHDDTVEITSCVAGYYYNDAQNKLDCIAVGVGNYSPDKDMALHTCPIGNSLEKPLTNSDVAASEYDCFATVNYESATGNATGTQVCDYTDGTGDSAVYASDCDTIVITSCVAGYYYNAGETQIDCVQATAGNYSPDKDMNQTPCPTYVANDGGVRYGNSAAGAISPSFCYVDTDYVGEYGSGIQICNYNPESDKYDTGCGNVVFHSCDSGYYWAKVGDKDCSVVDYGYYGPVVDASNGNYPTGRQICPDYNGIPGMTQTDVSGNVSECYMTDVVCDIENGSGKHNQCNYDATNSEYGLDCTGCMVTGCDDNFSQVGNTCIGCPADNVCANAEQHTCAELTDGKYPYADAGTSDVAKCWATCPDVENAYKIEGRLYSDGTDECRVTLCEPGFELIDGKCQTCPENSVCNPENGNSTPVTCPPEYPFADAGASDMTDCYATCADRENAYQIVGRNFWGGVNTCEIVLCDAGYTLANGVCEVCPDGSVCNPESGSSEPAACPAEYPFADAGTSDMANCYATCAMAENAYEMNGRDYYGITDTCKVTLCDAGYTLVNGVCEVCPDGSVCNPESGSSAPVACPVEYPFADAGTSDMANCYATCAVVENANQIIGRDYYGESVADTCEIVLCDAGYRPENNECTLCPAGYICNPSDNGGEPVACPTEYPFAEPGASSQEDCYMKCGEYDIVYGTALPINDIEFWPSQCEYKDGVSDTGNPCEIINGVCIETSCNYDYEMIDGMCQPCVRDGALTFKPGGNCLVASCRIGLHPNEQRCEPDVVQCNAENAKSATQTWNAEKQAYGECVITECEAGYHVSANMCQEDVQECVVEHGVGVRKWNHRTNSWDECIATKCDAGYTNDSRLTNEGWQQCGRCNNMYSADGELAASSYAQGCEIASCMYQGQLYTLENNECIRICDTYSDETGSRYWNGKECVHECTPGYMEW